VRTILSAYDRFENGRPLGNLYHDDVIGETPGHGARHAFSRATWFINVRYGDVKPITTEQAVQSGEPFIYEIAPYGMLRNMVEPPALPYWRNFPPTVLDALRQKRALLVMNGSWEGDNFSLFDLLHSVLASLDIPFSRVVVVTGNHLLPKLYEERHKEGVHVVAEDVFVSEVSRGFAQTGDFVSPAEALARLKRDTHFLSFNRIPRPHRVMFISQLVRLGLDGFGLVSMPSNAELPYERTRDWKYAAQKWPHYHDDIEHLKRITPMVVDRDDFTTNHFCTSARDYYLRTYFSVITETLFENTAGQVSFVSEKIYKPLASMHPFLLLAPPRTLAYIRSLGFRTFSESGFVNEDYDEIAEDTYRMASVLDELRRLCRTPLHVIREHYLAMMPILMHNQWLLQSYAINDRPEQNPVRQKLEYLLYG